MTLAARQRPPAGTLVLDHVSHFVHAPAEAARALEALGFTLAPPVAPRVGRGGRRAAFVRVMLERGCLEFLAPAAGAARVGLACFGTPAAEEEHARLRWHGFDPRPLVRTARCTLVRVPRPRMPEGRIEFVERRAPERLRTPQRARHPNGVRALAAVFVAARDPAAAAARWARFAALLPRPAGAYVHLATARGHVLVGAPRSWRSLLGEAPAAPGLPGCALECRDPDALAARCARCGLAPRAIRPGLYAVALPPALGGAWLFGTRRSLGFPP